MLEFHHVSGDDCLMLKVRARDPQHLAQILRERLGAIAGVQHTRTTIVLETIKESIRLSIPAAVESEEVAS
jgi:Lrp/AsnC family transcriptional regulator, leucine-responsive regulatory protein